MGLYHKQMNSIEEEEICVTQLVNVETNHQMTRIEHLQLNTET